jgi:hypothetical protein
MGPKQPVYNLRKGFGAPKIQLVCDIRGIVTLGPQYGSVLESPFPSSIGKPRPTTNRLDGRETGERI